MAQTLNWGILGTGNIAKAFARALAESRTGTMVAVGSRTQQSADAFGAEFGLSRCHGSYESLLADPEVQAVYISVLHPWHAEWTVKAAEAGKHILCEKPLAMTAREAEAMIDAARRHDVFLMEAFMYRCHPQTARIAELVRDGVIGAVRVIQVSFSFQFPRQLESRILNPALGGGGILDVGCYCASMARLVAGAATGHAFANPIDLQAIGHIGSDSRVDEYAMAIARFPGNILAQLSCGVQVEQENVLRVYGDEGRLEVASPWFCAPGEGNPHIRILRGGMDPQEITVDAPAGLYVYEADTVAAFLDQRQAPAMTWDDTLGNMRTLDRWREAIGMKYPEE